MNPTLVSRRIRWPAVVGLAALLGLSALMAYAGMRSSRVDLVASGGAVALLSSLALAFGRDHDEAVA